MMLPEVMSVEIPARFTEDPAQWLEDWSGEKDSPTLPYLLAAADDGVIWGQFIQQQLKLAGDEFPQVAVKLRGKTLQTLRLFGPAGELFIWRTGSGSFHGRLIADGAEVPARCFERNQLLWGTQLETKNGFSLMQEGAQGLHHAPPMALDSDQRCYLRVRHYVSYDKQDQATIPLSRLVKLMREGEQHNG